MIVGNTPIDAPPSYWPDGRRIVFVKHVGNDRGIASVNLDGAGEKLLADQFGADWPAVNAPVPFDIAVVDLATGKLRRITATGAADRRAVWAISLHQSCIEW